MARLNTEGRAATRPDEAGLLDRRRTFWVAALVIALLFSVTNLPWRLDDYDQAKQAFTSFEMVKEGHWLYQHTPNEKIATKPPLAGWISATVYGATRSWDLAWRLPSLAAAFALAFLLARAAERAYGPGPALLALAAFGLNLLSPRLATLVRTDMPLALVIFALGLVIWEKIRSATAWTARERWKLGALLTAAMLIKGPIVYAFLLPGIALFEWWRRRARFETTAWSGWWPWVGSLAVFALWAAGGVALVPGFYEQVVLKEFAGRFGETVHRAQPLFFYFPHLLHKFAPWSVLLLALAWVNGRTVPGTAERRSGILAHLSPETIWLIGWSLGGLVLMSLIPSKRVDRIFPVVPPLCLLLAATAACSLRQVESGKRVRRWLGVSLGLAVLLSCAYAGSRVVATYRAQGAALVDFGGAVRREAATRGWRYEVLGGKEEGLLLYLRRPRFLKPAEAVARWRAGNLDALVVPAEDRAALLPLLPGAAPSPLQASITIGNRARGYVLLTRE